MNTAQWRGGQKVNMPQLEGYMPNIAFPKFILQGTNAENWGGYYSGVDRAMWSKYISEYKAGLPDGYRMIGVGLSANVSLAGASGTYTQIHYQDDVISQYTKNLPDYKMGKWSADWDKPFEYYSYGISVELSADSVYDTAQIGERMLKNGRKLFDMKPEYGGNIIFVSAKQEYIDREFNPRDLEKSESTNGYKAVLVTASHSYAGDGNVRVDSFGVCSPDIGVISGSDVTHMVRKVDTDSFYDDDRRVK